MKLITCVAPPGLLGCPSRPGVRFAHPRLLSGHPFGASENCAASGGTPLPATARPAEQSGFTLLEVLVSLTVLAVGAALTLSLISGSLGNIRKVQLKTRTVEHAEAVMELALLDDSIQQPTSFNGDFEDGTRWSVRVEDYTLPTSDRLPPRNSPQNMPAKLLCYTVEMFSPDSGTQDYQLQTLKLVKTTPQDQGMRIQQ